MPTEIKSRHKEKSKNRHNRKKQPVIIPKKTQTRKVSEKYITEDRQVENSLKLREKTVDDDYAKQKQNEIDFFCDPFSSVRLERSSNSDSKDPSDENGIEEVSQKSEAPSNESPTNTHMASTYIGQELDSVVKKFELERISFDEFELLFHPKTENVKKPTFDEEKGEVFDENDGIFHPDPPILGQTANKLLLIDRLHESGNTEFTTKSNDFKNNPKIVDDKIYQLVCDKQFTPIFVPPQPMTFELIDKIISHKKFLKIYIASLTFDQHQKFTNEHHLSKIVEKLFGEYERRKKLDQVGTLKNKLINLREIKATRFPVDPKNSKVVNNEELALNHQIKSVRQKLHVEEKYDHMVLKNLLDNWKNLKSVRAKQGYSLTNIALKIQKFDLELSSKQAEWQQQYDAELNEMIAEEFDEYHAVKIRYKEFIRKVNDPEAIADEQEIVKKPKRPDIDKIVAHLNEIYEEIPSNEPDLNIMMTTRENSNENSSKPKEKSKKIKKYSYRFELDIDGEVIGSTKHCKLDEDFSIPVQSAFIVKLTKQMPEKVKLLVSSTNSLQVSSSFHEKLEGLLEEQPPPPPTPPNKRSSKKSFNLKIKNNGHLNLRSQKVGGGVIEEM